MKTKKTSKLFPLILGACAIGSSMLITSCKDDDKKSVVPVVEFPTEFDSKTVEENKIQLENNGIALVDNLTAFKNTAGIKTSLSFEHFLSVASLPSGRKATSNNAIDMLLSLAHFGRGKVSASDVLTGMRQKEDPTTAQEEYDAAVGIYTYNAANNEWTQEVTGDRIVFKFPATEGGTSNNAEFAIYGYTSVQVVNKATDYTGDLPTALKADLTVDGTKQIEYTFSASYKSNGDPESVATALTIGVFKLSFDAKNTTSEVGVNYALTKSGENLIALGAGATGTFNSDAENSGPGDVLNTSTAYFQLMNIKFAGEVKVKTLTDALSTVETIEQQAAAWNANANLIVYYADSKKKIADSEFYSTTRTTSEEYCYFDEIDQVYTCDTYEETNDVIDIKLVFADGSKSDLQTYTDIGFDELSTKFEDFADDLSNDID
jgi:hypothetical protein